VSVKAVDSDKEDGVFDNHLTELEKLDAANKAIVSNKAGELSELAVTNKAVDELNELAVAECLYADNVEKVVKSRCIFVVVGNHSSSQSIVQSSQKIRDIFVQSQITINLEAGPWTSMDEIVGTV
jgi:hypothetical protein